jgi:Rhodopirellula transposase DDE domain
VDAEDSVRQKWRALKATMGERARRLWAISTVRKGRDEGRAGAKPDDVVNVRRSAGKRPFEAQNPEVWPAIEALVDPVTRGDPESPLRWTCKSTHALSAELFTRHGIQVSDKTVAKLLREHGYSLQAPNKSVGGAQHPDRNAQFEHINAKTQRCLERGHVSHFPPGTSKWNKVEHRLFSFISINWRGRPLRTYETIISLISNTTNRGDLLVRARLDRRSYPIGKKVSAKDLRELKIDRDNFHGEWNYVVRPRGCAVTD